MNAGVQKNVILVIDAELEWLTNQSERLASQSLQLKSLQLKSLQLKSLQIQSLQIQSLQILTVGCLAAAAKICTKMKIETVVADSLQFSLDSDRIESMFLADLPLIIVSAGQRSAVAFKKGRNRSCFSLRKSSCVELLPCFIKLADSICERQRSRQPIKRPNMVFPSIESGVSAQSSSIHTLY
ncbi:MAG: hypothetical protein V3V10_10450 [Planctomycetota bacterium]